MAFPSSCANITSMNTDRQDCNGRNPVPIEYAGKWVAWNSDHSEIIASAATLQEVWTMTRTKAEADPVFEKVPHADVRFVGTR